MAEKTVPLKGWPAGVNNIAPDHDLPKGSRGETIHVRAAINLDALDSGKMRRRTGTTKVYSGNVHSAWSDGQTALFVEDGALKRLNHDYTATVLDPAVGHAPMQYLSIVGEIYYSNGIKNGKIVYGARREWGVEQPTATPSVTQTSGNMQGALYQVICTYVNQYGEESGCRQTRTINASGGMIFTLPQPTSPEVQYINIYMTPPDGEELYLIHTAALGQTFTLTSAPIYGRLLRTQFAEKMIPGELLELYRGVIYAAVGNIVWHTEPSTFGLYRPAKNYIAFPSEVSVLGAVQSGMYVVANTTMFLAGTTPDELESREIAPYGAAKFSKATMKDTQSILWRGHNGLVRGDDQGQMTNLQEGRVLPEQVERAVTLIKEHNSLKQVLSVGVNPPYPASLVATDYWEAEVISQRI